MPCSWTGRDRRARLDIGMQDHDWILIGADKANENNAVLSVS